MPAWQPCTNLSNNRRKKNDLIFRHQSSSRPWEFTVWLSQVTATLILGAFFFSAKTVCRGTWKNIYPKRQDAVNLGRGDCLDWTMRIKRSSVETTSCDLILTLTGRCWSVLVLIYYFFYRGDRWKVVEAPPHRKFSLRSDSLEIRGTVSS